MQELSQIVREQIKQLSKAITPHLMTSHADIFNEHVRGWSWLLWDERDWKWWWWCNKPWWNDKPCLPCNKVWHEYEAIVDNLEVKRKVIICELNPTEDEVKAQEFLSDLMWAAPASVNQ